MKPASVTRIRRSYEAIAPRVQNVVDRFYAGLFAAHPPIRSLFPEDMSRQRQHLAASLAIVWRNFDNLEALEIPLKQLGSQHAGYGVRPEHYPVVRDQLLRAMAEELGPDWTPQMERDWFEALNRVAAIMLQGAAEAALDAARRLAEAARRPAPGAP